MKDYYAILELPPSATVPEIRKAYRRLAHQWHPDKNPGDAHAAAWFAEVKEAYEVLTHPRRRDKWLQQRWYEQSLGRRKAEQTVTPEGIIRQSLELERHVSRLDHFRMDREGLRDYLLEFLSDDTLEKLSAFADRSAEREIVRILLKCLHPLPLHLAAPVILRLRRLAGNDAAALVEIEQSQLNLNRRHAGEQQRPWVILLVTALLCLLIWLAGR